MQRLLKAGNWKALQKIKFGTYVKFRRLSLGRAGIRPMSQEAFGKIAGYCRSEWNRIEKGHHLPEKERIPEVAEALNVDPARLFKMTPYPVPTEYVRYNAEERSRYDFEEATDEFRISFQESTTVMEFMWDMAAVFQRYKLAALGISSRIYLDPGFNQIVRAVALHLSPPQQLKLSAEIVQRLGERTLRHRQFNQEQHYDKIDRILSNLGEPESQVNKLKRERRLSKNKPPVVVHEYPSPDDAEESEYVITVADPSLMPEEFSELVRKAERLKQLSHEAAEIYRDSTVLDRETLRSRMDSYSKQIDVEDIDEGSKAYLRKLLNQARENQELTIAAKKHEPDLILLVASTDLRRVVIKEPKVQDSNGCVWELDCLAEYVRSAQDWIRFRRDYNGCFIVECYVIGADASDAGNSDAVMKIQERIKTEFSQAEFSFVYIAEVLKQIEEKHKAGMEQLEANHKRFRDQFEGICEENLKVVQQLSSDALKLYELGISGREIGSVGDANGSS